MRSRCRARRVLTVGELVRPAVGGPARSDRCREDREQLPNTTMAALIASMRPADGSDELEHLLDEQAAYYRALAAEYEDHALPLVGRDELSAALDAFRPTGGVLELAAGQARRPANCSATPLTSPPWTHRMTCLPSPLRDTAANGCVLSMQTSLMAARSPLRRGLFWILAVTRTARPV
jgi:hypothetical protein